MAAELRRGGGGSASGASSKAVSGSTAPRSSDVDELVEVRDEVLDQALTGVGDLGADPGHQGPQRDGRDDEAPLGVVADGGGRATPGSEHPFEFGFSEVRRAPEVVDDLHDP